MSAEVVPITAARSARRVGRRRRYVDVKRVTAELETALALQRRFRELFLSHEPWMFEHHAYLHALLYQNSEAQRLFDLLRRAEGQPVLEVVRAG